MLQGCTSRGCCPESFLQLIKAKLEEPKNQVCPDVGFFGQGLRSTEAQFLWFSSLAIAVKKISWAALMGNAVSC